METESPVNRPAETVTVKELDQLVAEIFELRAEIEADEAAVSKKNVELQRLKQKAVTYLRELDRQNYQSAKGTVSIKPIFGVKMPQTEDDKKALFDWMRDRGIYDKYATVNAAALKALFLAERAAAIESGEDPLTFSIPGMQPATVYEDLGVMKSRTKGNE